MEREQWRTNDANKATIFFVANEFKINAKNRTSPLPAQHPNANPVANPLFRFDRTQFYFLKKRKDNGYVLRLIAFNSFLIHCLSIFKTYSASGYRDTMHYNRFALRAGRLTEEPLVVDLRGLRECSR